MKAVLGQRHRRIFVIVTALLLPAVVHSFAGVSSSTWSHPQCPRRRQSMAFWQRNDERTGDPHCPTVRLFVSTTDQKDNTANDPDKPVYRSKLQRRMRQRRNSPQGDGNKPERRGRFRLDELGPLGRLLEKNNELPSLEQESAIDSFLRGDYDRPFAEEAPAPHPNLGPGATIDVALRSLRALNEPEPNHGAAVLFRFCAPLSRSERWGGGAIDEWKAVLRRALTPAMLARGIGASPRFSNLLDWQRLDVTEGLSVPPANSSFMTHLLGTESTMAFVSAALYFGDGIEPVILQFTLKKISGVWLIDTAVVSKHEWFVEDT